MVNTDEYWTDDTPEEALFTSCGSDSVVVNGYLIYSSNYISVSLNIFYCSRLQMDKTQVFTTIGYN